MLSKLVHPLGKSLQHEPSPPLPGNGHPESDTPPAPGGVVGITLPNPRSPYDGVEDVGGAGRGEVGKGAGSAVMGADADSPEGKWLEKHSFRARRGAYVTVKKSLDEEEEVRHDTQVLRR